MRTNEQMFPQNIQVVCRIRQFNKRIFLQVLPPQLLKELQLQEFQ